MHDNMLCEPRMFVAHVLSLLKGYKEIFSLSNTLLRQHGHWKRPPDEYMKLNVDGTLFFN